MSQKLKPNLTNEQIKVLASAAVCAYLDLKGIMPEFEPSGDREHPGWTTIKELKSALDNVCGEKGW